MTDLKKAAQQALEALEDHATQYPHMQKGYTVDAITALRAALEQPEQPEQPYAEQARRVEQETHGRMRINPVTGDVSIGTPTEQSEQEPVAWLWEHQIDDLKHYGYKPDMRAWTTEGRIGKFERLVPVFTHPPRREWRGLSAVEQQRDELLEALRECLPYVRETLLNTGSMDAYYTEAKACAAINAAEIGGNMK
jgi:hypothetical protein